MANKTEKNVSIISVIAIMIIIYCIIEIIATGIHNNKYYSEYSYSEDVFSIITTPENKVLEEDIKKYAEENDFEVEIVYADNLEIVEKLNSGEKYDAIWASNSIWLDLVDSSVKTSNLKSTSITPIVFGVKKSVAEKLGLTSKNVTMNDLLTLIKKGDLKFSMANPIMTNSGASAYFNILSTLAGNPEVLTLENLQDENLRSELKSFFKGLERTSGDEDFLEESFINGDYDAAVTYESSIISINKKLEAQNKEILYLIYPVDGVTFSDSPLVFVNNGLDDKKDIFLDFQSYILSKEGQKKLANLGRRTWYGGVTNSADSSLFKKEWGIDTSKYISSVKYPSKEVIKEALRLYQEELRKPVHVVFCLDYSGSMAGDGKEQLITAMEYIFGEDAKSNMIQFSKKDKIDVVVFNNEVEQLYSTTPGDEVYEYIKYLKNNPAHGTTSLFPSVVKALRILQSEEDEEYNLSIIVMTDGEGNVGSFEEVKQAYSIVNKNIPIYSITFGDADEEQLKMLADLTNGKIFDGKRDLVKAFKTVRGYN